MLEYIHFDKILPITFPPVFPHCIWLPTSCVQAWKPMSPLCAAYTYRDLKTPTGAGSFSFESHQVVQASFELTACLSLPSRYKSMGHLAQSEHRKFNVPFLCMGLCLSICLYLSLPFLNLYLQISYSIENIFQERLCTLF